MSWDRMPGGDKVRYCGACKLNVYNLAEMSGEEVAALFRKGRVCGRLYMRDDRTATLRDCGQGRVRRTFRRAIAVAGLLLLGALGWVLRTAGDRDRSVHPPWVRDVVEWVDPKPPRFLLGEICPPAVGPVAPLPGTPR